MALPVGAARIIELELARLASDASHDLVPALRVELFQSLGPSAVDDLNDLDKFSERMRSEQIPILTRADRVRARIGILTAQKVAAVWQQACHETDLLHQSEEGFHEDSLDVHLDYFRRLQAASLEDFPVQDVPRPFIPQHILAMSELAIQSRVRDSRAFFAQANEWWQIYPSPKPFPREFAVKWAAHEALYLCVLWQQYLTQGNGDYNIDTNDVNKYAYNQTQGPMGYALLAYAGVFDQDDKIVDPVKRQEFWLWWLGWAIPTAFSIESE